MQSRPDWTFAVAGSSEMFLPRQVVHTPWQLKMQNKRMVEWLSIVHIRGCCLNRNAIKEP
jgi:hypothetical protein